MIFNKLSFQVKQSLTLLGFLTLGVSSPTLAQSACQTVPNDFVADVVNTALQSETPMLHINQVDQERMERKARDIFLPGDSWIRLGDREPHHILHDLEPVNRRRRSHFINDLNSNQWQILPAPDGLRLRIDFETDGNEIKGWCRKCRIRRRRDRAAADANILPRSSEYPFVEVTLNVHYTNAQAHLELRSPEDVHVDMKLDGNGILELFEGRIERALISLFQDELYDSWGSISELIEPQIADLLAREIDVFGYKTRIVDAQFHGNDVTICME